MTCEQWAAVIARMLCCLRKLCAGTLRTDAHTGGNGKRLILNVVLPHGARAAIAALDALGDPAQAAVAQALRKVTSDRHS